MIRCCCVFSVALELCDASFCASTRDHRSISILEHLIAFRRASSPIDSKASRETTTRNHQLLMHLPLLPLLPSLLPQLHQPTPRSLILRLLLLLLPNRCTDLPQPQLYGLPCHCRHLNSLLPLLVCLTVFRPSVKQKSSPLLREFAIPMLKFA